MKIAVIVDDMQVADWQSRVLAAAGASEILVYNCTNSRPSRKRLKHAFYYALNLVSIRNPATRRKPLRDCGLPLGRTRDFESEYEGAWQRLPGALLTEIGRDRPAVILKFGMNLLRIPPAAELPVPILSYHHGDPDHYRGRPAGFYELLHGRRELGQIVQVLSNALDAGRVVAFGETKVVAHSYRATLVEAYRKSPLLIRAALDRALRGEFLLKSSSGAIYRLPSNRTVLSLVRKMGGAGLKRLVYGAFFEKAWQVSTVELGPADAQVLPPPLPPQASWRTLDCPLGYSFVADPFFSPGGEAILVEALDSARGKGAVFRLSAHEAVRISPGSGHYSYPAPFREGDIDYVVPEISLWSGPTAFRYSPAGLEPAGALKVPGAPPLVDPTLFRRDGKVYLFASLLSEGNGVLRLWCSDGLFEPFEEHPGSPLRVSPAGSRMGGAILDLGGRLVRFGQDDRGGYGDGLILFEIETLTPRSYREEEIGTLRFDAVKGPHTFNLNGNRAVFDWYRERFALYAGIRRLRGRLL
jgi:hypothetical protein